MKLVLGTVQFGLHYGINSQGRPSQEVVTKILTTAYEKGLNMLDTSAAYGDSEYILGKCIPIALKEKFKIISKYPQCTESVTQVLDKSLGVLGVKNIYDYLLHHFIVYKNDRHFWAQMESVKKDGKVKKIGFSLYSPIELEEILNRGDKFDIIQVPYNIFDRQFEPYLQELKSRGVEIHVRSTFLQGLFFMDMNGLPSKLEPLKPYLRKLHDYAKQKKLTISQIALNYNLQNPLIDGVLIGVDNVKQLEENIGSVIDRNIDIAIEIKEKSLLSPVNWN